ncbi:hypothetical protein CPC16_011347 [Podila verticillata]|nr:hypothetical protein CPC16_011347 [Podila verticillata]
MFKKAVRLTKLGLSITDFQIISKANVGGSSETLPSLQSLELTGPYNCAIHNVLNDTMHAFGWTLQTVSVKMVRHNEYTLAMDSHNDTFRFGEWNMPFIQHIELSTNKSGCTTSLGAFDQCPLWIYLRMYCAGTLNMTNPSQITDLLRARAPVWHLPKLKRLCLYKTLTLLFNYDSPLNMPNLEILLVGIRVNCEEAVVAPLLPSHRWDASELQVGTASNDYDISTNTVHD